MTTYCVLNEKPSQAEECALALGLKKQGQMWMGYSDILNGDVIVVASRGHIIEMDNPYTNYENWDMKNLPVLPDDFNYSVPKNNEFVYKNIRSAIEQSDVIIIGTDADREGEAIAYRIFNKLPKSLKVQEKIKYRLWLSSLTKEGIIKAFKNLRKAEETVNLYHEANARSIADWLVGFNFSPFISIKMQQENLLEKKDKKMTVGRVQTPIVTIIVENDEEIANFESEPVYTLKLVDENETTFSNDEKFESKFQANKKLEGLENQAIVKTVKKELKETVAPKLHSLGSLTSLMSDKYKIDSSETLEGLKSLYQKKYTSYPRSELNFITHYEFEYLKNNIEKYQNVIDLHFDPVNLEPRKQYVNDKKVEEYSHYALIPTENIADMDSLSDLEKKVYTEVVKRTLLMFADNYKYESTTIVLTNNGIDFKANGNVKSNDGWTAFEEQSRKDKTLPSYDEGSTINVKPSVAKTMTKPPKRITESILIQKILPKYNLGTSATTASIIKNIKDREYIRQDKKTGEFFPTKRGIDLVHYLKQFGLSYTNPETTGVWEKQLELIGKGKKSENDFVSQVKVAITKQIEVGKDYVN